MFRGLRRKSILSCLRWKHYKPGSSRGIVPPLFGQKSARWPDVFAFIMQPKFCWAVWGPKSVDRYTTVQEIWTPWIDGEAVYDAAGIQTGKKPAIKLVEQYLQNKWRTPDGQKERGAIAQHWGRYREIPEWIECEFSQRVDKRLQASESRWRKQRS
ncbi:hypothetical protein DFH08DRAFT_155968 [Mycena albidolilacea]|uniref:Uncharacterized protein n=1 Tax=Mycena albidolilacea TaxID=1033008 RepID=A0AAD7A322_9AGAR|nr:hypothetical protein DFH08DRAFT_155968 [Mycena albidolilacea]